MKLNCKPGDLAVVVGSSDFSGLIVNVLHRAPQVPFNLPDGYPHIACPEGNFWVIEFKSPIPAFIKGSPIPRQAKFATGRDDKLRPIRPGEGDDETLTWAGKPEKITA